MKLRALISTFGALVDLTFNWISVDFCKIPGASSAELQ